MLPVQYLDLNYKKQQAERTKLLWKQGKYKDLIKNEVRICVNPKCLTSFNVKPSEEKKYCGSRCAAIVNNSMRPKKQTFCLVCSKLLSRPDHRYCSVKCQHNFQYKSYINKWKKGLVAGTRGINTIVLSRYVQVYLLEKYGQKCSLCGWNKINPITNKVPLEIDHIDGNSENNKEENLRLICPNCHALTPYFRNLNKGNGRAWRLQYLASKNFSSLAV